MCMGEGVKRCRLMFFYVSEFLHAIAGKANAKVHALQATVVCVCVPRPSRKEERKNVLTRVLPVTSSGSDLTCFHLSVCVCVIGPSP